MCGILLATGLKASQHTNGRRHGCYMRLEEAKLPRVAGAFRTRESTDYEEHELA